MGVEPRSTELNRYVLPLNDYPLLVLSSRCYGFSVLYLREVKGKGAVVNFSLHLVLCLLDNFAFSSMFVYFYFNGTGQKYNSFFIVKIFKVKN